MDNTRCIVIVCLLSVMSIGCYGTSSKQPTWCPRNCTCDGEKKSVSCKDSNFTEIPPDLPTSVRILELSQNKLKKISNRTFIKFQNLTSLSLDENEISVIEKDAFKGLDNLQGLWVGGNPLNITVLEESVFGAVPRLLPSLHELHTWHLLYRLRNHSLDPLRGESSLRLLDLSTNRYICDFPFEVFSGLILQTLNLANCQCDCMNFEAFVDLKVKSLILGANRFVRFPSFPRLSAFRKYLTSLDLQKNAIFNLEKSDFEGFDSLQKLILDKNSISSIQGGIFADVSSLQILRLSYNRLQYIDEFAFNSTTIRELDLDDNLIHFESKHVNVFRHAVGIKKISLKGSYFKDSTTFENMFQNIITLSTLDLTEVKVPRTSIHRRTFSGLDHLSFLSLNNFGLKDADPDVFQGLQSLRTLNLMNNELRVINASSFPLHFLQNITRLYLANNPFECSCELFWFKNWINENHKKLISYRDNPNLYRCASPPSKYGTRLLDLTLSPEDCVSKPLDSYVWVTFGLSSFQLLVTLLVSIVYRLRWHLRLWSFHLGTWMRSRWHKRPERQEDFKFDLFVSHNSSDSSWVKNVLLPELEERSQPPFRLCVYTRNWLAGRTISDCIIESLALSRKTLLLVTNAFAKSEWCQFEMTMAQHRLIATDNDNVLLAVMEDIEPMNLNPRLRLMMKKKIYLAWTDDPVGQLLFWKSLKQLLRSDGGSLVESSPSAYELRSIPG